MGWKYCIWELENISIFVCLKNSQLFIFSKPCPCCNVMQAPLMLIKTAPNILISSLYSILFLLEMIHKGQNYVTTWTLPNKFQRQQLCKMFQAGLGLGSGYFLEPFRQKSLIICWNPIRLSVCWPYICHPINNSQFWIFLYPLHNPT